MHQDLEQEISSKRKIQSPLVALDGKNRIIITTNASQELISPPYTPLLNSQQIWNLSAGSISKSQNSLPNMSPAIKPYSENASQICNDATPIAYYTSIPVQKIPFSNSNAANVDNIKSTLRNNSSSKKAVSYSTIHSSSSVAVTYIKKKRKMQFPQKSVSPPRDHVDRSFQRIVTLDVYAAFKANPALLLGRSSSSPSVADTDSDDGKNSTASPVLAPISNTTPLIGPPLKKNSSSSANQSACKILPSFIMEREPSSMNLSAYKNTKDASSVSWKGAQPLLISPQMADFDELTVEEIKTCATLRILPSQYLEIKRTLLTAVEAYGPFKKREAQTWFRIDVNKICIIYDWFRTLGWIPNSEDWAQQSNTEPSVQRTKKVRRR